MCRMIAFVGGGSADLQSVFRAFREGSQCDPYVSDALGKNYTCHPNGWGLALYDGRSLHHYRSSSPAWREEFTLPPVNGENIFAIFHSRLASNPALNSPICSHPFITTTDREVLLLAHNGAVDVDDPSASRVVDSEWVLDVIAKAGGIEKALPRLKERTKQDSALNLLILAIPRDGQTPPAIQGVNFFKTENPGRVAYYTMYRADFGGGTVFMSSTFKDGGLKGLTNITAAPFGEVLSFRAKPIENEVVAGSNGGPRHSDSDLTGRELPRT